jgi:hypothetical protein
VLAAAILGDGDGLAARELLKYPQIRCIRIVDVDPAVTDLARTNPLLGELNARSLWDERVEIVHQGAWVFLAENATPWPRPPGSRPSTPTTPTCRRSAIGASWSASSARPVGRTCP